MIKLNYFWVGLKIHEQLRSQVCFLRPSTFTVFFVFSTNSLNLRELPSLLYLVKVLKANLSYKPTLYQTFCMDCWFREIATNFKFLLNKRNYIVEPKSFKMRQLENFKIAQIYYINHFLMQTLFLPEIKSETKFLLAWANGRR